MNKDPDAFRTISEAADDLGLPQHVLRFWETRFAQIKPLKRAGGRRYYRSGDINLLRAVKKLLHVDGYTIKGVQRLLKEKGGRALLVAANGAGAAGPEADEENTGASGGHPVPAGAAGLPASAQAAILVPLPLAASTGPADNRQACADDLAVIVAVIAEIAACQQILRNARGM